MFMKNSSLGAVAAVALATAAGTAQAVNIATDGIGEVVVGSYYTAQPGYQTLINLTNTQSVPVAVKIRIHEARNSRDVLDYTVTLSAFDVYTAVIREVDDGATKRIVVRNTDQTDATGRTSCTVPQSRAVTGSGPAFNATSDFIMSPAAFGGNNGGDLAFTLDSDGGPTGIDRLREGYIEIISMGYFERDQAGIANSATDTVVPGNLIDVGNAIENHQCNLVQASFSALNRTNGVARIVETARQSGEPINAIKGNFRVLNIGKGTESDVPALTLANFYNGVADAPADPTATLGTTGGVGWRPADSLAQSCVRTRGTLRDNSAGPINAPNFANAWTPGNRMAGGSCNNLITKQVTQAFLEPTLNDAFPPVANITLDAPNASFSLTPTAQNLLGTARGIDAVSTLIQRKSIINEWVSNTFTDGTVATDWVVTMPTKLFYVDGDVGPQAAIYASFVNGNTDADVQRAVKVRPEAILAGTVDTNPNGVVPGTANPNFGGPTTAGGTVRAPVGNSAYRPFARAFARTTTNNPETAESCVQVGVNLYDRAEQTPAGPVVDDGVSVSPAPPRPVQFDDLCYEVNVVSFDGRDGGLGHVALNNELNVDTTALTNRAGWLRLEMATGNDATEAFIATQQAGSNNAVVVRGLPVIGFAIKERIFGTAAANYSSTAPHGYTREVRNGTATNAPLVIGLGANNAVLATGATGASTR